MATRDGFERKRVLIDRDFQFKYLITWIAMTMVLLGGLVLASVSMFFLFKVRTLNHLVIGNAICAVIITVLSMRYMIRLSHRIAGPAFRLERAIREVADGKHSGHVKLRSKDYLKHIAESVNYLIDKLEDHQGELDQLHRCARQIESRLVGVGQPYDADTELKQLTRQLAGKLSEMSPTEPELDETHTPDDGDGLEADAPVETAGANV